ncbi:hypothetical protein D3C73_1219780 [compost metagenome]
MQEFAQAAFFDRTVPEDLAQLITPVGELQPGIERNDFGERNSQVIAESKGAAALVGQLIHLAEDFITAGIFGG